MNKFNLMLRTIILISFCIILIACGKNPNQTKSTENTSKKEIATPQLLKKESSELFFQAQGNEPAWKLIVNKKADTLNYILELEYKKILRKGIVDLKRLDKSHYASFELLTNKSKTEIKLKAEKCNDMAGNSYSYIVTVHHNGSLYFGCGDFLLPHAIQDELKSSNQISHYICYSNDNQKDKKIWIGFNKDNIALKAKYQGQNEAIELEYLKNEYTEGGAHPTTTTFYNEIYGGQINGKYITTHSGNWDYVEYKRGKDNKVFKFTIDHRSSPYGKKPCF